MSRVGLPKKKNLRLFANGIFPRIFGGEDDEN